jgi:hypothetical protein
VARPDKKSRYTMNCDGPIMMTVAASVEELEVVVLMMLSANLRVDGMVTVTLICEGSKKSA